MTVAELIAALQELPQDHLVVVDGYEGGTSPVLHIRQGWVDLEHYATRQGGNVTWFYGRHSELENEQSEEFSTPVVYLPREPWS